MASLVFYLMITPVLCQAGLPLEYKYIAATNELSASNINSNS